MRKYSKLLLASGALALLSISFLLVPSSEPRYKDQTLSYWLNTISGFHGGEAHANAQQAILEIGTNGLPHLLRWIAYEPQPSRSKQWVAKATFLSRIACIKRWLATPDKHQVRAEGSVFAFYVLGARGSNAVPELTRLAVISGRPVPASRAVNALKGIGPPGLSGLIELIQDRGAPNRSSVIRYLGNLGTNALLALPSLTNRLLDPEDLCAAFAARSLGRIRLEPGVSVPALQSALQAPRRDVRVEAAYALLEFGDAARPAVPALRAVAVSEPDPVVRTQIEAALSMLEVFDDIPLVRYTAKDGKLRVEGRSSIHDFVVEGREILGFIEVPPDFPEQPPSIATRSEERALAELSVPVRSLKSVGNGGAPYSEKFDQIMYEKLGERIQPAIRFQLRTLIRTGAETNHQFNFVAQLAIGGRTNTLQAPVTITRMPGSRLRITGALPINPNDFGIPPPVIMDPPNSRLSIKVLFDWTVERITVR